MRFGLGFGAFYDQLIAKVGGDFDEVGEVSGIGTAFEFALGGTPSEGFVVGGGIFGSSVLASNLTLDEDYDGVPPAEVDPASASLTIIGPFVDRWFPVGKGYHLQGALGLATLSGLQYSVGRYREDRDVAFGVGAMIGLGHEWWIGERWGVGILGRVTGAAIFQEDDSGTNWIHVIGTMPSVLFTATYQ